MLRLENQVRQLIKVAELNGIVLIFQWLDGTDTSVDPGPGQVRGNSAQVANVTQFAFSDTDSYGRVIIGGNLVKAGDIITFSAVDLTASEVFQLTTDPVPQGSWFQFNVVKLQGATGFNPQSGEYMRVSWRPDEIIETRDI